MLTHGLGIVAATAVIVLATLLPFLPGEYDSLAVPLWGMARAFGFVGLILVPIGALWVLSGYWNRLAGKQHGVAVAALIASSILAVMLALVALASSGPLFGLITLAFWIWIVSRVLPGMKALKIAPSRPSHPAAFYLLVVPLAVAILQFTLIGPMIEISRARAIRNSAQLIADIEQHRVVHGRYPVSLLSVWRDYKPGVIGIWDYLYEPSGDAYNLVFEQPALNIGTREFVVYNPRDEQTFISHRIDRLQMTPQQMALEQTRGYYAVHDAPYPHWKYFWFD